MDKYKVCVLGVFLTLISACEFLNREQHATDDFYETFGGWDWIRIPLIKPYAAKKVDPEINTNPWIIDLKTPTMINTSPVKKVSVRDSILYIQSGMVDGVGDSTALKTSMVATAWYVIDVRKNTEDGFSKEEEFNSHIAKNKYPTPQWHNLDSLSKALGNGGKLPWRPN